MSGQLWREDRGQTWGNSFIRDPKLKVERGRWNCVEFMVKMNDPDDRNGELALVSMVNPSAIWARDFRRGNGPTTRSRLARVAEAFAGMMRRGSRSALRCRQAGSRSKASAGEPPRS